MSALLTYIVSTTIAAEVVLFGILQVANRSGARRQPYGLGWFYFTLCTGMFIMAGTSLLAYLDTFTRLRELDDTGKRYIAATDLMYTLTTMEAGQRGFLLTGRSSYLEPYRRSAAEVHTKCKNLLAAYKDSQALTKAQVFCQLAESKTKEMEEAITFKEKGETQKVLEKINADIGRDTMTLARIAAIELIQSDLGRYNASKTELIQIAEGRIILAVLVGSGSIIQMWMGAFCAWRIARPPATSD